MKHVTTSGKLMCYLIAWILPFAFVFAWILPPSWSSGTAFVSGARDLRLKSQAGQIGYSVAYGSPPLQHFLE